MNLIGLIKRKAESLICPGLGLVAKILKIYYAMQGYNSRSQGTGKKVKIVFLV